MYNKLEIQSLSESEHFLLWLDIKYSAELVQRWQLIQFVMLVS